MPRQCVWPQEQRHKSEREAACVAGPLPPTADGFLSHFFLKQTRSGSVCVCMCVCREGGGRVGEGVFNAHGTPW